MDKKQIEQWAREAGIYGDKLANDPAEQFIADAINAVHLKSIASFAALVAAHEREQCALVCENTTEYGAADQYCETKAYGAAEAIRARGSVPES